MVPLGVARFDVLHRTPGGWLQPRSALPGRGAEGGRHCWLSAWAQRRPGTLDEGVHKADCRELRKERSTSGRASGVIPKARGRTMSCSGGRLLKRPPTVCGTALSSLASRALLAFLDDRSLPICIWRPEGLDTHT